MMLLTPLRMIALVLGVLILLRGGAALRAQPPVVASADRSPVGRRLHRAMIRRTRANWFRLGVVSWGVSAAVLTAAGSEPTAAAVAALTAVRGSGALILIARRHRRAAACAVATPRLARALAVELAAGCSMATAVTRAGEAGDRDRLVAEVLGVARQHVALGVPAARALATAVAAVTYSDRLADDAMRPVVAVVSVADGGGIETAAMLQRLAQALDGETRSRRRVATAATEARFVASALPVLTIGMTCVVAILAPRTAAAALAGAGTAVCGLALLVAATGVAAVLAVTRT